MSDERRVVSVLFADVTGSTALGEALDPEDLRALLSRYYGIARDVVEAHGGTVEKFIGDAVMAVFGLRRAHGDDAVRAVSAAIELRDRVRSDARLGDRMPIRLGVNTGDVVASRDPTGSDFLVTGDAVNVAARLQQDAAPWSIVCGERTVRAARAEFRFAAARPVDAKGKSAAVMASEVLGRAHSLSSRTPIFGRDADLAQIELVARRAFDERRPYLVSVIAPAGTGKTRLLEEFLARLPGIDPAARIAVAQCLPYGQRLTYWPLRAVLFRVVGIDEDAPAEEIRRSIDHWLAAAEVEDAADIGALLASTLGAGDAEAADRAALFAAWRTFIEAASHAAPLVVAIEDLHWSSDTLLDLFEFVLQPRADTRALLIAIARPELLDRRPTWGGGRRNHVSIALEPLDDRSTTQLVRTLAEGAPQMLVDAVVARAEGNPFFAGEIVGTVLENVRSFDDPEQIEQALARLPDTVQATVLARLDALPADEREALRTGSVFGRTFRPAGVAALEQAGDDVSVADVCERLAERDLIRPTGADGYSFRHILIREVAYSTLPRSVRARLHGAAGHWLEERAAGRAEALAELVAFHYREAATLATALELDDAPELRERARTWLVRAAEVARSAAATIEARQHARAALEFAREEDMPELLELLGDNEIGGGEILERYARALDAARAARRPADMQLRLLAKMLIVETRSQGAVARRPTLDQISQLRDEGRQLMAAGATDLRARGLFLAAEGFVPFWARANGYPVDETSYDAAAESASQALAIANELGDFNLQSAALDALGSVAQMRAQWARAMELGRQRIAMGSKLALFEQIDAHSVTAWAAVESGDLAEADRVSAAGLALVQPGQAPEWTLHLAAWRIVTLMFLGGWDEAEHVVDRAHRLWTEAGRPPAGYSMRGFVAGAIIARGRRDEARSTHCLEALDAISAAFTAPRAGLREISRWDVPALAVALAGGNLEQQQSTLEYLAMALGIINDVRQPVDVERLPRALEAARAGSRLAEAQVLRTMGLAGADEARLGQARAIFAASGARPFEARTRCEMALLSGSRDELEAGIATLDAIGDAVQVERYEKAWAHR